MLRSVRKRVGMVAALLTLVAACVVGCTPPAPAYTGHYPLPAGYASAGRTFWLHTTVTPGPPRPLVIFLPGWHWTAAYAQSQTGATGYADWHNFSLVYAEGIGAAWNAGGCCGNDRADDDQYLADVVAVAAKLTPVDRHRIYLMGFSNGGMMAF
jgi:polyhydroxybutyrate depolymerase